MQGCSVTFSNICGFPRIGPQRELKFALEKYWKGNLSRQQLEEVGAQLRQSNWRFMQQQGIGLIPSNDFSYYDHVLDMTVLVGAIPDRFRFNKGQVDLDTYFAMARGRQGAGVDVEAMEMTKWFDTNYHNIVPELGPDTKFKLSSDKPFREYQEALSIGINSVPVLLGPISFLLLSKPAQGVAQDFNPLVLLDSLLGVYEEIISKLKAQGAEWVQLDEPVFVQDRSSVELEALRSAYERLANLANRPKIVIRTYFGDVGDAYDTLVSLPVEGLGLDLSEEFGSGNWDLIEQKNGLEEKVLFAGIVNGRNVWVNDLSVSLEKLNTLVAKANQIVVSTSCSLLHVPYDVSTESNIDPTVKSWLAFAYQKVQEVTTLTRGLNVGKDVIADELAKRDAILANRKNSRLLTNPIVQQNLEQALAKDKVARNSDAVTRKAIQKQKLGLPILPTTTIGSFPQTQELRKARQQLRKGEITQQEYEKVIRSTIEQVIQFQKKVGLDVLVHGEAERNDMVQFFAEKLDGFAFTNNGWVQSYGSRCIRPPILFGDVFRPSPMTVELATYAQSLTDLPVKGMLTGPLTMLKWSFVRDDQPPSLSCIQLGIAIGQEVKDLEAAGIGIIQVDEPALREGLPLKRAQWDQYLDWATKSFRLSTYEVSDETQIHTHMCYAEFGDIISAIDALDADVISVEASRSRMELLGDLAEFGYSKDIGPGVYDIHSPRIPSVDEMVEKLKAAVGALSVEEVWVNPDCGLKTRGWSEVEESLINMTKAAEILRQSI